MNKVQNLVLEELCMSMNLITHSDSDMDMILADSVENLSRLKLFFEEHVFRHADLLVYR